jgi:putative hemolysin
MKPGSISPKGVLLCILSFFISAYAYAQAPKATDAPPSLPWWGTLLIILGLVLFNAVFALAESALLALRPARVEQMQEEGRRGAKSVRQVMDNIAVFSATMQIGRILVSFTAAVLTTKFLANPLAEHLIDARFFTANSQAVVITAILIGLVMMVVGEIAPRSLVMQSPDAWALRLAPFVQVCGVIFTPFRVLTLWFSNLLVRPFGAKAQFATPMITREEFGKMLDSSGKSGEIDNDEAKIINNVFDLSETLVRSVMTPRTDMTALPVDATLTQIIDMIVASGHSRLPVYEESVDNILGMMHVKDLLPRLRDGVQEVSLRRIVRPAIFIPETRRVSELLEEMRRSKNQIAIVQDEYAGTAGIVSIEDLLEEIVGDIRDEYDVDEPDMQVLSATESLIDARMSIDDVNDRLGTHLEDKDYETIGGLVFGILGHEPLPGERVESGNMEFVVEEIEGRRVKTIRAIRKPEDALLSG